MPVIPEIDGLSREFEDTDDEKHDSKYTYK